MKNVKFLAPLLIILLNGILTTGCWNYREIDKLAIVAGIAVDKDTNGQYRVTAEIAQISGGKDTKTTSKLITMKGKTMMDAVRNGISLTGKRLYWSHAKVLILSTEIAGEGITKVIDWYNRDAETREDVDLLISQAGSAKEIFAGQETTEEIKSYALDETIKNQTSLSKAPVIDILKFDIESQTKGMSVVIPAVRLEEKDDKMVPQIMGTAIVKNDKLVGFLDGDQTKDLLFIRGEVKGGVLIEGTPGNARATPASLEIFNSKTKVTPVMNGKDIEININIDTIVAIDEIEGTENFIEDDGRRKLEQSAAHKLKKQIESLIKKIQSDYDADIFGFGAKLNEDQTRAWRRVSNHWEEIFKDLKVNVKTKVHIKNSAILSKTFKKGD